MPLTVRLRGRIFHCRGVVRVGKETRTVPEHSTGQTDQAAAEEYAREHEREVVQEILYGPSRGSRQLRLTDCLSEYLDRAGGVPTSEDPYIGVLDAFLGETLVSNLTNPDLDKSWPSFVAAAARGEHRPAIEGRPKPKPLSAGSISRYRDVAMSAMRHSGEIHGFQPPKLIGRLTRRQKRRNRRLRWLTFQHADTLTSAYAEHAIPIIRHLRFQGCRTQECLQLDVANCDFSAETFFYDDTKSGIPRRVKMHPRVAEDAYEIWKERGKPDSGPLYLSSRRDRKGNRLPYADTRTYTYPGGNPLRSVHSTALKAVEITPNGGPDFRIHDWRSHWACWFVMNGGDIESLRINGGWESLESVEHYMTVSVEHADKGMRIGA